MIGMPFRTVVVVPAADVQRHMARLGATQSVRHHHQPGNRHQARGANQQQSQAAAAPHRLPHLVSRSPRCEGVEESRFVKASNRGGLHIPFGLGLYAAGGQRPNISRGIRGGFDVRIIGVASQRLAPMRSLTFTYLKAQPAARLQEAWRIL